jgi:hypothetical protein
LPARLLYVSVAVSVMPSVILPKMSEDIEIN